MAIRMLMARKRLAVVWFVGGGLIFSGIFFQTIFEEDGTLSALLWSWFQPAIIPNLSLIAGVFINDLQRTANGDKSVDAFLYRLALWLSVVYLVFLCLTPLLMPFANFSWDTYLQNLHVPQALLQALATAALGAFYVRR